MAMAQVLQWRDAWRWVERLSIYLPVLLMALLAMGSYWLLRATPEAPVPAAARAVTHHPDDVMRHFSVRTYGPDGVLRAEVFGEEARHYPDDGSTEIDTARILNHHTENGVLVATAQRVWTDAERSVYELTGNAVVVRDATTLASGRRLERLEFHGEHLRALVQDKRLVSDQPVRLLRGTHVVTADRLDYSDPERVAVLTGRVRAHFPPATRPPERPRP
jgi:lipopolysaccharide export system protein LptC